LRDGGKAERCHLEVGGYDGGRRGHANPSCRAGRQVGRRRGGPVRRGLSLGLARPRAEQQGNGERQKSEERKGRASGLHGLLSGTDARPPPFISWIARRSAFADRRGPARGGVPRLL